MREFTRAAPLTDLEEAKPLGVTLRTAGGVAVPVLLVRKGEQVFALRDECTHVGAPLCDGIVEGFELECPWHYARFDLRTGEPLDGPVDAPVAIYAVRIDAGEVYVSLEAEPTP